MVGVWAKAWPCAKYANNYIKKTAGPERVKCKKNRGEPRRNCNENAFGIVLV